MRDKPVRRALAYRNSLTSNQLHYRRPWMAAWWSAAFPGCGHFYTSNYLLGFLFMVWEYTVNTNAHLNLAIILSFQGEFEKAKSVIDLRWCLFYLAVYVFAFWDSYRRAAELNIAYVLANRERSPIRVYVMSGLGVGVLERTVPWVAAAWAILTPGLGHVYLHRLPAAVFGIFWFGVTAYCSHLLEGIHYTILGEFEQAKAIVDPQWLLFLPSLYGFSMFIAYVEAVEQNRVFDLELARFLEESYQDEQFLMPL